MKFFCPYCTAEITPETTQCPTCGYFYGPDTLSLLTGHTQKTPQEGFRDERRKHIRTQKKFKIAYRTPSAFIKSYLHDIGTGGLFIKTNEPLNCGEKFGLKISLPDNEKELEVLCEVAWNRKEEGDTLNEGYPLGMGVKFLNPPKETLDRIIRVLRSTLS